MALRVSAGTSGSEDRQSPIDTRYRDEVVPHSRTVEGTDKSKESAAPVGVGSERRHAGPLVKPLRVTRTSACSGCSKSAHVVDDARKLVSSDVDWKPPRHKRAVFGRRRHTSCGRPVPLTLVVMRVFGHGVPLNELSDRIRQVADEELQPLCTDEEAEESGGDF